MGVGRKVARRKAAAGVGRMVARCRAAAGVAVNAVDAVGSGGAGSVAGW